MRIEAYKWSGYIGTLQYLHSQSLKIFRQLPSTMKLQIEHKVSPFLKSLQRISHMEREIKPISSSCWSVPDLYTKLGGQVKTFLLKALYQFSGGLIPEVLSVQCLEEIHSIAVGIPPSKSQNLSCISRDLKHLSRSKIENWLSDAWQGMLVGSCSSLWMPPWYRQQVLKLYPYFCVCTTPM